MTVIVILFVMLQSTLFCAEAKDKISVFVSVLPQKYFVDYLAGDLVETTVMLGPGMSPHSYEPSPRQMAKLTRSKLFFALGQPFETTIVEKMKAVCPEVEIIHCDAGINRRFMQAAESIDEYHEHDEDCDHAIGSADPHVWLDPINAKIICKNMADALQKVFPKKKQLSERCDELLAKLDNLHQQIKSELAPFKGRTVLVFHPAFGYFTDRYNLYQRAIQSEGKEPSPRQMAKIIRECKAENIKTILVQQQFSGRTAETIASSIDGVVVALDPLQLDYFDSLQQITSAIKKGMQK